VLAESWRDALGGEWGSTVAGTPGTWKQVKPAAEARLQNGALGEIRLIAVGSGYGMQTEVRITPQEMA
jgi:hypothetical protein